jgi:triphosphoribosyl-dephospho-CoA synthase
MKLPLTWPAAPAFSCERSRSPSHLARLAREALIAEAELTPKPGLVDRRSSGSHTDLSLARMMRSAQAIEPYFRKMAEISIGSAPNVELRQNLGAIGRQAERAMYTATEGSNSHKGAIWSLGLLISAAAMQSGTDALHLARIAATIASQEDQYAPVEASHGILVARRYGVAGARHEATTGFPRVTRIGLPILRAKRSAGVPEVSARLDALLGIMSQLTDTCVLYRGGWPALRSVQQGAKAVLAAGGFETAVGRRNFLDLDLRLRALDLSPGGSADLLAATLLLDAIERQAAATAEPEPETLHGND